MSARLPSYFDSTTSSAEGSAFGRLPLRGPTEKETSAALAEGSLPPYFAIAVQIRGGKADAVAVALSNRSTVLSPSEASNAIIERIDANAFVVRSRSERGDGRGILEGVTRGYDDTVPLQIV